MEDFVPQCLFVRKYAASLCKEVKLLGKDIRAAKFGFALCHSHRSMVFEPVHLIISSRMCDDGVHPGAAAGLPAAIPCKASDSGRAFPFRASER